MVVERTVVSIVAGTVKVITDTADRAAEAIIDITAKESAAVGITADITIGEDTGSEGEPVIM